MAWDEQGSLRGPKGDKGDPGTPAPQDAVTSTTIATIWSGTQAAYDALGAKDPATLYVITEDA